MIDLFQKTRSHTEALCAPLKTEDYVVQSMPDVSPPKWHLAHTSWFFESFVLRADKAYRPFDEAFGFLFNSYYKGVGEFHPREQRGLLSRPTVEEVYRYRRHVTEAMVSWMRTSSQVLVEEHASVILLGIQHEQQHQELLVTDIKHILGSNPLDPVYKDSAPLEKAPVEWISVEGGLVEIGAKEGFSFDNETPRHKVWLEPFQIASRLVTNGEYLDFIEDGGYENPLLWLSNGWATVEKLGWSAPLYWRLVDDKWTVFTLAGRRELNRDEPLLHVSFYEADAFARWKGKRLPTEFEWETAARRGNLSQVSDVAWQWTASPYVAYPGFRPFRGDIAEYNGKFMCDQWVLRGGSLATPPSHSRLTYRNFFPADARWQFTSLRLAF